MKLEYDELAAVMRGLELLEDAPALNARKKLSEFFQTSGTTCPTAILSCPSALGSRTSERKRASSRENGKKGGRPKKIDSEKISPNVK